MDEATRVSQVDEVMPVVLDILERWRGSSMVMSRADMCARLRCTDRVLRAAVAELRKAGYLIVVDDGGGYRFARSVDDVVAFTSSLKKRIQSLREVVERMEAASLRQFGSPGGQMELFG